jgi:phage terminase small subunit
MKANQRWEKFAQKIVEGGTQVEAYQAVYKCKSKGVAKANATALMKNPNFSLLLQKYQDQVKEKHEGIAEQTIKELSNIAFSDITNVASLDADLNLTVEEMKQLPTEIRRTIQSFTVNRIKAGRSDNPVERVNFKLKLYDKMSALNTLTKILGITKEDGDSRRAELEQMTKAELLQLIVKKLSELEDKYGNIIIPIKAISS